MPACPQKTVAAQLCSCSDQILVHSSTTSTPYTTGILKKSVDDSSVTRRTRTVRSSCDAESWLPNLSIAHRIAEEICPAEASGGKKKFSRRRVFFLDFLL